MRTIGSAQPLGGAAAIGARRAPPWSATPGRPSTSHGSHGRGRGILLADPRWVVARSQFRIRSRTPKGLASVI
jgi:hypothetical protein